MADSEKEVKAGTPKKSTAKKNGAPRTNPVSRYLRETRGEMRKVTWPTREESWRLTAIVMAVSLAFSIFLWIFDTLFSNSVKLLIDQLIL